MRSVVVRRCSELRVAHGVTPGKTSVRWWLVSHSALEAMTCRGPWIDRHGDVSTEAKAWEVMNAALDEVFGPET